MTSKTKPRTTARRPAAPTPVDGGPGWTIYRQPATADYALYIGSEYSGSFGKLDDARAERCRITTSHAQSGITIEVTP